jgi:hypothetical protein
MFPSSSIQIENGTIRIQIPNPEMGKEGDLLHFYTEDYFNLVGIHPEIHVNSAENSQTGGGSGGENSTPNGETLTVPYKYFDYFMKNNPISLLFRNPPSAWKPATPPPASAIQSPPSPKSFLETLGFAPKKNTTEPEIYKKSQTILSFNPTEVKQPTGTLTPTTGVFNATPTPVANPTGTLTEKTHVFDSSPTEITPIEPVTSVSPSPVSPTPESQTPQISYIELIFHAKNIQSMEEIVLQRNPELDIELTPQKFKYNELYKIHLIKEKKHTTDIFLNEIFYIDNILIILKGMPHETPPTPPTPLNLQPDEDIFIHTHMIPPKSSANA